MVRRTAKPSSKGVLASSRAWRTCKPHCHNGPSASAPTWKQRGQTLHEARAQLGQPFKHAEDLQAARAELERIDEELNQQANPTQVTTGEAEPEPTSVEPATSVAPEEGQWPPLMPRTALAPTAEQSRLAREQWPATRREAIELLQYARQAMERAPYDPAPAQAFAALVTEAHRRGADQESQLDQGEELVEQGQLVAEVASAVHSGEFQRDRWWEGGTRRDVKELIEAAKAEIDRVEPGEDSIDARHIFTSLLGEARRRYGLETPGHPADAPFAQSPNLGRAAAHIGTGPTLPAPAAQAPSTGPSM